MKFTLTIPVCVDHYRDAHGITRFRARPVFAAAGAFKDEMDLREDRALAQLGGRLGRLLLETTVSPDHRDLLPWSFCPPTTSHLLKLRIELKKRSVDGAFFAVVFENAGRRLVHLSRGGLSFEWPSGTQLRDVATRILTAHFRQLEKEAEDAFDPSDWFSGGQPHVVHLPVALTGNQRLPIPGSRHASYIDDTPMDGERELHKVGRCLDRLYPQDLQRALLREAEVAQLWASFRRISVRTPMVVLVGRPKAGKTAIIHECVRKSLEAASTGRRGQYWLVSPQRVISGMSYLGQWEERWTAMLSSIRKDRHILVLDDLLGLFEAGRSSGSDLTLGHVLKARQEHEPIPVLAEATPEAWGRLREIDRSFASQFQVIHVREMGDDATLRILVRTMQELPPECNFSPEVLPEVIRLQQRFGRAKAFPGKAVEMLQALANTYKSATNSFQQDKATTASQVLEWFADRHGISLELLKGESLDGESFGREDLRWRFSGNIMGQTAAVEAMMDIILMASAEVQDPLRPLGSLLFLGPTGVGKTECAKMLAKTVFQSEDRMVRFDLNEYTGDDAAIRLIGGPGRGGLLTSRVRRQPFTLLLFDEVEKAHPDVFDLLLQVLGEGRLTDAQGQTTDFCNCIIILTSNIGARQSRQRLGFGHATTEDAEAYRQAAEKFFRPEFFNRLDRIVPFHELRREDIEKLAQVMAQRAMTRQGLSDRQVDVSLEDDAIQFLAEKGHQTAYGARSLRRAVETLLVEPLAARMASVGSGEALKARVTMGIDGALSFDLRAQEQTPLLFTISAAITVDEMLDLLDESLDLITEAEERLDGWKFDQEEDGTISRRRAWYFRLRDECSVIRKGLERLEDTLERENRARQRAATSRAKSGEPVRAKDKLHVLPREVVEHLLQRLISQRFADHAITEILDQAVPLDAIHAGLLRLLWRARHLISVCHESMAHTSSWTIGIDNFAYIEEVTEDDEAWPQNQVASLEWCGAALAEVVLVSNKKAIRIVDGPGLEGLVAATTGVKASCWTAQSELTTVKAWRTGETPPESSENQITWLYFRAWLLDLRTGLLISGANQETGDMAMAVCYGQPASIPDTPNHHPV
ncbi:ATP-dependent Clp protease ATP-binding subunit ClpA [Roseimicrobium gellanilyticum]|uniref:ATP-dependent Clp protease ATP-binding subunit ClpA n=1 Tax=Roseimicrobium gellanilyticum TaxID=748857 RepID=A0A366HST7_9BACT|nr:AAA family ATPase [Roseimicrobium gellanilyticum]RBP45983.1 ATP-dependent Clp protease ATP-binding subunit ClpA [Roseimicrobium gellanilyticum]